MTVWSEFQPLKKIVLGNVFPPTEFLENLDLNKKWKSSFEFIVQKSIEEFGLIKKTLESLNVDVHQVDLYPMKQNNELHTPPLAPRDFFLIYGDKCIEGNEAFKTQQTRVKSARKYYSDLEIVSIPTNDQWYSGTFDELEFNTISRPYFHTANVLRCGYDIFISKNLCRVGNQEGLDFFKNWIKEINPNIRFHYINCEEHLDSSLFFVKPGLIISSVKKTNLPDFFKNWTVIEYSKSDAFPGLREKIYGDLYAYKFKKLNPIIAQKYHWFLQCNPEETLFSMNALNIDMNTVIFPGFNKELFNKLEKYKINCLSVDMRAISFWDNGLHCSTNEIHRIGDLEDYS